MKDERERISVRRLSRLGAECWREMKAIPVLRGRLASSSVIASRPPAEAPIATTGNVSSRCVARAAFSATRGLPGRDVPFDFSVGFFFVFGVGELFAGLVFVLTLLRAG